MLTGGFELSTTQGATLLRRHRVSAVFTRRDGPVDGALGGTNMSRTVGDDPASVAAARRWAASLTGLDADRFTWGYQVHGRHVVTVTPELAGRGPDAPSVPETDALVSTLPGVPVGVLVADCVPVLIAAESGVAVAHAGWRGLAEGVVEAAVAALRSARPGETLAAAVGPSIGLCCFEVGTEVAGVFAARWPSTVIDTGGPRPYVDLPRGVAMALAEAGVDDVVPVFPCTRCRPDVLWSHRAGAAGRQALVAGVVP